jgi:hypothetical protein
MIGIHSTWLVRLSRGPFWDQIVGEEYRSCRENWWTNLLYINNYVNRKRMVIIQLNNSTLLLYDDYYSAFPKRGIWLLIFNYMS